MALVLMLRVYIAFAIGLKHMATQWLTLLIQSVDPSLALGDQLWLEAANTILLNLDLESAVLALNHLAAQTVAPVSLYRRCFGAMLLAKKLGQLRSRHPMYQRLLELLHQPAVTEQIFRPLATLHQFVQYVVVDLLSHGPRCPFFSA